MVSIDENLKKNYSPLISILSTDEIHRYHSYKDKKAQYIFLVSHIALRLILGKSYDVHPKKLVFEFNKYGKPYLKRRDNLYFNLSHSTKRACIIESDVEVGIDIEYIQDFNYEEIINSFFSDNERQIILHRQNKKQKLIRFFEIWTQKEALLKCVGTGLVKNIEDINVEYLNRNSKNEEKINIETILSKDKKYIFSFAYQSSIKRNFYVKKFNLVEFLSFYKINNIFDTSEVICY